MSIVKVIEVIASSEKGFDDAVRNAVQTASQSVQNINSVYVKEMNASIKDKNVISYAVNAKISFVINS